MPRRLQRCNEFPDGREKINFAASRGPRRARIFARNQSLEYGLADHAGSGIRHPETRPAADRQGNLAKPAGIAINVITIGILIDK
jgi:hypothetical protein